MLQYAKEADKLRPISQLLTFLYNMQFKFWKYLTEGLTYQNVKHFCCKSQEVIPKLVCLENASFSYLHTNDN